MTTARLNSGALSGCLTVAMLAGCGGGRAGMVPPSAAAPSETLTGKSGDLLYVSRTLGKPNDYRGVLSILSFPDGKLVATIATDGFPTGLCSDTSGNVWAIVVDGHHWNAYEYAHGGTKPIAKIHIPYPSFSLGCAVDPSTGNLAVLSNAYNGSQPAGSVDIWPRAREGPPTVYSTGFTPSACAYDDSGNLFVDGDIGDTVPFELAELRKGDSSFTNITLYKRYGFFPGGMQWDGKYLAMAPGPVHYRRAIYRLRITGSIAKVAQTIHLAQMYASGAISIHNGMIAATSGSRGDNVAVWRYPAGGAPAKILLRTRIYIEALTISPR